MFIRISILTELRRYEFEDKKEYLAALHAQQRTQQASTHFTTDVSKVLLPPGKDLPIVVYAATAYNQLGRANTYTT